MKVKMLRTSASPDQVLTTGEEYDLEPKFAKVLIDAEAAISTDGEKAAHTPAKTVERATGKPQQEK